MIQRIKDWWAKEIVGVDAIAAKLAVNAADVMNFKKNYSLPMERNDTAVWRIEKIELRAWTRDYSDIVAKARRGLADIGQAAKWKKPTFQKEKRW